MTQLMMMEGLRLTAYRDAAGVPTIGYGHTKGVRMGDRITEDWARQLLRQDVAEVERQVKAMRVASSEGQLDALVSFAYNVGIGRLRQSTLLRRIREGGTKLQMHGGSLNGTCRPTQKLLIEYNNLLKTTHNYDTHY